jgi:hypothetical protein
MNIHLESFLQDLAQGVFGDTSITYSDIYNFEQNADQFQKDKLYKLYWFITSEAGDNEDMYEFISQIEELIKNNK